MNREAVEGIFFKRSGGGSDDDIFGAGLPGIAEEFVESADLDLLVGGENGDLLLGGFENLVDKVGDDGLPCRAGDADEFHIFDRVAIISIKQAGFEFATFFGGFGGIGLGGGTRALVHKFIIA